MGEIELTQGKVAIVDDEDFDFLNKYKWYCDRGYVGREARLSDGSTKKIYIHRIIARTPYGMATDHINGNPLDNRKDNLRICSKIENLRNRGKQKNNTSGYKGVFFNKADKRWVAKIEINGKKIHLGNHKCKHEAAKAYNKGAIKYHGEFAYLNEVKDGDR